VRWTAPSAGTYAIVVTFTGIDSHPTSTDVHVLHNSSVLFTDIINEYHMPHAFSTTRFGAAGDILDFIVGVGPNGTWDFDTTALDVTITQIIPLTPLAAHVALSIGPDAEDDTFTLSQATFLLGDSSDGIDPLTEAVTLRLGTVSFTISPGAFHSTAAGAFAFAGVIDGVTLQVTLTPLTRATFEVVAHGAGATLTGIAVPVPVGLTIGDDSGSTTLPIAEIRAQKPPPQR
jgi:hypothetical protein